MHFLLFLNRLGLWRCVCGPHVAIVSLEESGQEERTEKKETRSTDTHTQLFRSWTLKWTVGALKMEKN